MVRQVVAKNAMIVLNVCLALFIAVVLGLWAWALYKMARIPILLLRLWHRKQLPVPTGRVGSYFPEAMVLGEAEHIGRGLTSLDPP